MARLVSDTREPGQDRSRQEQTGAGQENTGEYRRQDRSRKGAGQEQERSRTGEGQEQDRSRTGGKTGGRRIDRR